LAVLYEQQKQKGVVGIREESLTGLSALVIADFIDDLVVFRCQNLFRLLWSQHGANLYAPV
jgi:hypothetical protein